MLMISKNFVNVRTRNSLVLWQVDTQGWRLTFVRQKLKTCLQTDFATDSLSESCQRNFLLKSAHGGYQVLA